MKPEPTRPLCPHCGSPLQPFRLPDNSGWDEGIHLACFSDDCPYFRRGWTWMLDHYGVKASYRFRIDPVSGTTSPLPVWSKDAVKDHIIDADVTAEPVGGDVSSEAAHSAENEAQSAQRRAQRSDGNSALGARRSALKTDAKPRRTASRGAARTASSGPKKRANPPRKGKAT